MDIKSLINKVIASKGILRVPSWWMKKLLTEIVEYIDSGDSANANSIVKVKKEADGKISTLESNTDSRITTLESDTNSKITTLESDIRNILLNLKRSLPTQKCFVVETGSSSGYVIVDDVRQDIPANTKKVIAYVDSFKFYDASRNPIIFIGLSVSDTSSVTNMGSMFDGCSSLTSLDLTGFNTSSVTNMQYMLRNCDKLKSLNLSSFDTSAVTDMSHMFSSCASLTSLDLTSFDTSAVTGMFGMFEYCIRLTSLDLTSFDTSSVIYMHDMFYNCRKLTTLDLTGFNTSAVTGMGWMFRNCESLTSLDLTGFNTSSVTNMEYMFWGCSSLTSLLLGPNFFKTPEVKSIDFSYCYNWENDTVVTSLVTNSYNRKAAGLKTFTLKLSSSTKSSLSDEQKAAITSKGYTIA